MNSYNLVIKPSFGTKFHNGQNFIEPHSIGISDGTIQSITAEDIEIHVTDDGKVLKLPSNAIIMPGIVDLHTHFARNSFWGQGMNIDADALRKGTILAVDAGSNGYLTFDDSDGMLSIIEKENDEVCDSLGFINIASFGLKDEAAENDNLSSHSVANTIAFVEKYSNYITGIKIRLGWLQTIAETWKAALLMAKEVASKTNKPLMIHIAHGPDLGDILNVLDGFDQPIIITHCFHGLEQGTILRYTKEEWKRMRDEQRVLFDLGNGGGSYSYGTTQRALDAGFELFSVSTDLHKTSKPIQAQNMPHCMNKVISQGIQLEDAIRMSTFNPASAIGQSKAYGTLAVGRNADITILEEREFPDGYRMQDFQRYMWRAQRALVPTYVVKDGELIACT